MTNTLGTYLNDHLAGSRFAIDMLERLRESHPEPEIQKFAGQLLDEIVQDRAVLEQLIDHFSAGTNVLKEATAWLGEKASRLKLRLDARDDLATYEAFEALSLGVLGKLKLWQALAEIAEREPHLQGIDLAALAERAKSQHDAIDARRLQLARTVLHGDK